ncbi:hypothetical protein [Pedobacter gandavensis]|uniref:Uncharacterized protein n=1 Tax=Pedobacter gandavensis TaxID=2679963 RepID=A0ABR6F114_9SPHI|nr:hypothetical protein [Pedobacter gandavensis]MBB2151223.1 hypothetical protein [Pedobacter gandavensis]
MKTNFKPLRLAAVAFALFALPFNALADSFDLYLCGTGTASLIPDATVTATLKAGDILVWQEWNPAGDTPIGTVTQVNVTTNATAPSFPLPALATGAHNFKVFVISASPNSCSGDVSPAFKIYSLPVPTVALTAPVTSFCEENSNAVRSAVITATALSLATVLSDVSYEFTWTATKNAAAVGNVTTIGEIGAITTPVNVNTFTLNSSATKGDYVFIATVKYKVASGTLKSDAGTGCVGTSTASPTITVTPKPATPTIVIAP